MTEPTSKTSPTTAGTGANSQVTPPESVTPDPAIVERTPATPAAPERTSPTEAATTEYVPLVRAHDPFAKKDEPKEAVETDTRTAFPGTWS